MKDEWDILDLYFKNHKYPFTSHHLDSYRDFIKNNIPNTIKSQNPITMIKYNDVGSIIMKVEVYIGGEKGDEIYIDRPITFEDKSPKVITPNDARLKNLTYETHLYGNVLIKITDDEDYNYENIYKNVALGSIPIMLHSDPCILNNQGSQVLKHLGECVYDTGGYFIIDGKEKVIIAQERITSNRLFTTKYKDDQNFSFKGLIKCTADTGETVLSPKNLELYLVKNPVILEKQKTYSEKLINFNEIDVSKDYIPKKNSILCTFRGINGKKIPLFILFRALGIESDKEIYDLIFGSDLNDIEKLYFEEFIRPTILASSILYTQEEALNYMKPLSTYKTIDHVKSFLVTDIFPNIPIFKNKSKYLGYLVKQFINTCLNIQDESDRDSYIYKRVDISGYLLSQLFSESYTKLTKFIRDSLDKTYNYGSWKSTNNYDLFINENNIYKIIPSLIITKSFLRSLKGMWGLEDDDDPELGMVQDLSRISYIGFLSHLRNVNMPLDRSIKLTSPHRLHSQQYGIICPFATPDGASVGYLKNLALLAKITSTSNIEFIKECLDDINLVILLENVNITLTRNITKIFLNGSYYGITYQPNLLIRTLKAYRRNNLFNVLTSISWDIKNNDIRILTDSGRCCRPLIINNNNNKNFTNWFDMITGTLNPLHDNEKNDNIYYKSFYKSPKLLPIFSNKNNDEILIELEKNGAVIEYIDIDEQDTIFIAMNKSDLNNFHTHIEIHPSTMMSAISANIPLSNHNQSARNVFHAAQSKQAIGIYATNFNKRFDTMSYVLHYPQKPLITTRISHYTSSNNMPNGANLIVAIMTYSGFNQEDSIMINKASLDRGLFSLSYYKSVTATAKIESQYEKTIFANPLEYKKKGIKVHNLKNANYNFIDNNGFSKINTFIPKGQKIVVIGMLNEKTTYKEVKKGVFTEFIKETIYTDCSIVTDNSLYGKIDNIFISNKTNDDDTVICKLRFLKIKKPEFGDKHASRHGQKGVIGMIIPEENMPFSKNGIKPDIIINPHAIPSRMTIGHLVECVFAKLACIDGYFGDGTVFLPFDENIIFDNLENKGFNKHGNEILYNGNNGNQIGCEIFIGPTFYFRLKHMVAEKMHARDIGPKVSLTRQPTAGRRKGGGLRIGEMERDSLLSHGLSQFIQESMTKRSDDYKWYISKKNGTIVNNKFNFNNDDIIAINTPYCFKLLTQELQTMGLQMRLNTDKIKFPEYDLDDYDHSDDDSDNDDNNIITGGAVLDKRLIEFLNKNNNPDLHNDNSGDSDVDNGISGDSDGNDSNSIGGNSDSNSNSWDDADSIGEDSNSNGGDSNDGDSGDSIGDDNDSNTGDSYDSIGGDSDSNIGDDNDDENSDGSYSSNDDDHNSINDGSNDVKIIEL